MRMYFGRLSRRLLTQLLLLMALPVAAQAQTSTLTSPSTMSVRSFTLLESDLTAQNRTTMVLDQNGDKCALIRIQTTQKGFSFDVGSAGVQKVEDNHVAEVWVYVPFGVRHISIRHPQLGSLRYDFPINIQKARTYEMVLSAGQVQTIVQQDLGGSYFVMNVAPANAIVVVDDAEQVVEEGVVSMFLTYGRHSYRVSSPLYQSEAGNIEIGLEKKTLDISLKPDYGQLEISTMPENGARVYIDGSETPAGTTPFTTDRLPSGEHTLRLQLAQYESRTMQVTLPSDGSTQPLSVALTPTYGILNIKAPQGCHIYVNNEDKGADFWSGRLSAGPYVVEARRASHRSTSQRVDVVRGEEQRIELAAPTPIYGSLNVSSKPVGAEVYLDGTKLGTTPDIFRNVLEGTHSIELRKPGFATHTEQVTITEGKVSDLSATLSAEEKPKPAAAVSGQSGTLRVNTGNAVLDRLVSNMVYVEGGTFTMGATSEQGSDADSDEKPAHSVTLSSYYIGKYEVTQAEWKAVMGSNPSNFTGDDNLPVECVSWNDCQEFIKKLNAKTGLKFRLPTEAEWEYAARGGNKSRGFKYAGSNNIADVAWYQGNNGSKTTHAVGTKQPNELGLYDMSGNVWEWCGDWNGSYSSASQTNPMGASSGSDRVIRGGSWYSNARYCRVSRRNFNFPDCRSINLGLRLVLSVQP